MPSFTVLACVLCEEVRQEANGRSILIGASNRGPDIAEKSETILPRLGFYIEALVKGVEHADIRLLNEKSKKVVFEDQMTVPLRKEVEGSGTDIDWATIEANMQVALNLIDVSMPASGKYLLEYSIEDGAWQKVRDYMFFSSSPDSE